MVWESGVMSNGHRRREFLKTSAALVGGVAAGSAVSLHESPSALAARLRSNGRGLITGVEHSGAMKKLNRENPAVVERMTNEAMLRFTGKRNLAKAYKAFFSAKDIVGVKLNCLAAPGMSTSPAMVAAIVRGLHAAGIPNERIYLYEQYEARLLARGSGFKLNSDPSKGPMVVHLGGRKPLTDKGLLGYEAVSVQHGSGPSHYANLLKHCTAIINVPVIKDHNLSGVTVGMKNMSHGNINNPQEYHQHDCNPQIADIYNHSRIRDKVRLIICDGLRLLYDGGPQDNNRAKVLHNRVYVGTDPVAMDAWGERLIVNLRNSKGLSPLAKRHPQGGYIARAASLGLGEADTNKIHMQLTKLA
jgi:hypothetical protein